MPDREKVIGHLNDCIEASKRDNTWVFARKDIVEDAIALLKEQEPLAVYEGKVNKCLCGNGINRYWHPEYCGFCGKKLEWYKG